MSQCLAETADGAQCGNKAQDGSQTCHLHSADDIPQKRADDDARTTTDGLPETPDESWFDNELNRAIVHNMNKTNMEKVDDEKRKAARIIAWHMVGKHDGFTRRDGYVAMFGLCPECEKRGKAGFSAEACGQCETDDGDDDDDESQDEDTMTVTIDGQDVTGTKDEIQAILGQ